MEKIWLKNYPPGEHATINPDEYPSLTALIEESFHRFAEKPAYESMGTTYTYHEIYTKALQLAGYLQNKLHLKKGDRLAIMMPNLIQYPVALIAALHLGLVIVNLNPLYTERELLFPLKDSGAKAIIVLANFARTLVKILPQTQIKNIIITQVGDEFPTIKRFLINNYLKYIKRVVPTVSLDHVVYYHDIFSHAETLPVEPARIESSDLAFLQYTGGTTGRPKGAMLTHRNMVANVLQCLAAIANFLEEGKEIVVVALPLYHIFSLTACCLAFMKLGGLSLLIANPRDMKDFIKHLTKNRFTIFIGVNTLFLEMMRHEEFRDIDFSHTKLCLAGGMGILQSVADRWQKLTKKCIVMGYGLTEASPVVTVSPLNLTEFSPSIGLPVPSTNVAVVDESGEEVPLGQPGELTVQGPQVMKGYWNKPEETKLVLSESGWLRTGDIVTMDDQGYVYLIDRKKDMILVSGFNVYPIEVEEVIASHPGVLEVAVIGIPDQERGESIKAFIVRKDPNLTEQEILSYSREKLTGYKVPKHVEFRETLPKSNVGKILKRALREEESQS